MWNERKNKGCVYLKWIKFKFKVKILSFCVDLSQLIYTSYTQLIITSMSNKINEHSWFSFIFGN